MLRASLLIVVLGIFVSTAPAQRLLPQSTKISAGGSVNALVEFNGRMIIGGNFGSFNEHVRNNIIGWDGASIEDMVGAFEAVPDEVRCMMVFDGALVVAGIEGQFANIARWDGSTWTALGTGLPSAPVNDLAVWNGVLYAGTGYGSVYGWDGLQWSPLGNQLSTAASNEVKTLEVFQGQLYAGGTFHDRVVRWNGGAWELFGPGVNSFVNDMLTTQTGLFIGGTFSTDTSGTLQFPYYLRYDGSTFSVPFGPLDLNTVSRFVQDPQGTIIIGSFNYKSRIIDGTSTKRPTMQKILCGLEYDDKFYVGGEANPWRGDSTALAVLLTGTEVTELDANNLRVRISPSSHLWASVNSPGNGPLFEAPVGSMLGPMTFWNALFSGEVDTTFYLQAPAQRFDHIATIGPHAIDRDFDYYQRYHGVWRIERETIEYHQQHYQDPGYTVPLNIASWPGNGDVSNGEPAIMAPFTDLDEDGSYEPANGDYPLVRGDLAVYYIQHDADDVSCYPQRALLDRHVMHYAFRNSWDAYLSNAVFTNIKLVNRSQRTYTNARFGALGGYAIGCADDDLIGCDTTLSLSYAYNASPLDNQCNGSLGYGSVPPALGIAWLSSPMSSHVQHLRQSPVPYPVDSAYHFELNGLDQNGAPILDPSGNATMFEYYGDPNAPLEWNDTFSPAHPDRLSLSAIGPFTIAPGDTLCVDLAFVFAQDSSGGNLGSVALLKERVAQLRQWYQAQNVQCNGSYGMVTGLSDRPIGNTISVHPNPANDLIHITALASSSPAFLMLFDARGQLVHQERLSIADGRATIGTNDLSDGLYHLVLHTGNTSLHTRVVIAR